jgi:transposase-like protein
MKSPDKTKAKMKSPKRAVNPSAVRSAPGATEDVRGSPVPTTPADIDTEVLARARRRHFSNSEKRRILQAVDQCTQPGEIGALLRREGVYSSSLSTWRRQRDAADLAALAPQKRGPKVDPSRAEAQHIALLVRENERLKTRLDKALLVIEVQKKVATLLGLASTDDSSGST